MVIGVQDGPGKKGIEMAAEPPTIIYALIYIKPINEELRYTYVTTNYLEAVDYRDNVFKGTTIVSWTVAVPPGP